MAYDVAIVGGGVVGWSSAWHLLQRSPKLRLAVIDPHPELASSHRGAGGVRAQFASKLNVELSLASIEELLRFQQDTGHDVGFRQVGYMLFAADYRRAEAMKACVQLQRDCGVPVRELTPAEIREIAPYVDPRSVVYGTISYSDGLLDGPELIKGYRNAALKLGAVEVRARGLEFNSGVVATSDGEVEAPNIVISTGHWSSQLGLDLPVKPERHQLFFRPDSGGIPDDAPMIIDADTTFHFRRKGDGVLVGYSDRGLAHSPCNYKEQPVFEPSVFFRMRHENRYRCPILFEGWSNPDGWGGCYSCTPDGHAILGRLSGLVIATGFGGHGVMHSPAAGRIVADLILDGDTSFDLSDTDPARFGRADFKVPEEQLVF